MRCVTDASRLPYVIVVIVVNACAHNRSARIGRRSIFAVRRVEQHRADEPDRKSDT